MPAVHVCIYIYIYIYKYIHMSYDIGCMYLNIRHKSDFAATEHPCSDRIHISLNLLRC